MTQPPTPPTPPSPPQPALKLRVHQKESLDALAGAWAAGRRRAWVALPPGAGKTYVGLVSIQDRIAAGVVGKAVVLGPNTAIQGQWERSARELGLDVGIDRSLSTTVTALTYQALAVFDPDSEVDDDGIPAGGEPAPVPPAGMGPDSPPTGPATLISRLHANGQVFVEQLKAAGPLLLVLDECHHLLEVWGRLLGELLDQLPDAMVLGLTATPPEALSADQAVLVDELFGPPLYRASIPAVVKVGDLAPYVELAWLTTPTPAEADWLKEEAARFQELITQLTAPGFGSMPFLQWLDARFVASQVPWFNLMKEQPELCRAVLRLHHVSLLRLPPGARLAEEHRTAADRRRLVPAHRRLAARPPHGVRAARGRAGRRGGPEGAAVRRLPVDEEGHPPRPQPGRPGARPERVQDRGRRRDRRAPSTATSSEGLRMLVLTDHERAGATLPADLTGVIDQQSGSAHAMLNALVTAPETGLLAPMLVTGQTVAGAPGTLLAFQQWLPDRTLADKLRVEPLAGSTTLSSLVGPWESRDWVGLVTTYFQDGHTKVLTGTRALLGEGWDAKRITGLADVTAVTTITSVVQTRGRALRTDPLWPEKVAVNWSLVCVTDTHPKGGNDWDRLVRKHAGFMGLDVEGQIVDGVAHLDPAFSPFVPPPVAEFPAANARALLRSEQRALIREQWQVGQPYVDATVPTIRIKERGIAGQGGFGLGKEAAQVVLRPDAAELRGIRTHRVRDRATSLVVGAAVVAGLVSIVTGGIPILLGAAAVGGAAAYARVRSHFSRGRELLDSAETAPSVVRVASAVADGLLGAGLTRRGSDSVEVVVDHEGEYRCLLRDVVRRRGRCLRRGTRGGGGADRAAAVPDPALGADEGGPPWCPRSLGASAGRPCGPGSAGSAATEWSGTRCRPHSGLNAERAAAYAQAWDHWIGGGDPVYTGSPEGQGILAANQGTDPFDASTVMRRQWS